MIGSYILPLALQQMCRDPMPDNQQKSLQFLLNDKLSQTEFLPQKCHPSPSSVNLISLIFSVEQYASRYRSSIQLESENKGSMLYISYLKLYNLDPCCCNVMFIFRNRSITCCSQFLLEKIWSDLLQYCSLKLYDIILI